MHRRMRNYSRACKSHGCGCDDYDPRVTCAGCGSTTNTAEWIKARGEAAPQEFCETCRTVPGHAFLARPRTLETRR
jgi:hypothetical protein